MSTATTIDVILSYSRTGFSWLHDKLSPINQSLNKFLKFLEPVLLSLGITLLLTSSALFVEILIYTIVIQQTIQFFYPNFSVASFSGFLILNPFLFFSIYKYPNTLLNKTLISLFNSIVLFCSPLVNIPPLLNLITALSIYSLAYLSFIYLFFRSIQWGLYAMAYVIQTILRITLLALLIFYLWIFTCSFLYNPIGITGLFFSLILFKLLYRYLTHKDFEYLLFIPLIIPILQSVASLTFNLILNLFIPTAIIQYFSAISFNIFHFYNLIETITLSLLQLITLQGIPYVIITILLFILNLKLYDYVIKNYAPSLRFIQILLTTTSLCLHIALSKSTITLIALSPILVIPYVILAFGLKFSQYSTPFSKGVGDVLIFTMTLIPFYFQPYTAIRILSTIYYSILPILGMIAFFKLTYHRHPDHTGEPSLLFQYIYKLTAWINHFYFFKMTVDFYTISIEPTLYYSLLSLLHTHLYPQIIRHINQLFSYPSAQKDTQTSEKNTHPNSSLPKLLNILRPNNQQLIVLNRIKHIYQDWYTSCVGVAKTQFVYFSSETRIVYDENGMPKNGFFYGISAQYQNLNIFSALYKTYLDNMEGESLENDAYLKTTYLQEALLTHDLMIPYDDTEESINRLENARAFFTHRPIQTLLYNHISLKIKQLPSYINIQRSLTTLILFLKRDWPQLDPALYRHIAYFAFSAERFDKKIEALNPVTFANECITDFNKDSFNHSDVLTPDEENILNRDFNLFKNKLLDSLTYRPK